MPTSRSSQPLSELVRLAWEGAAPGAAPNLLGLIEEAASRGSVSEAEIADACVEDAEQRMERGLECRLEHYLEAVPKYAGVGEVVRAVLMLECSARGSDAAEVVAEDLRRRFPAMLEHVDAVAEMMVLMRSVSPVDAAPEIGVGTLLDEYRLEEWLGAGSFGEVWRAWDRTLERYVALKLIPSRGTEGATLAAVIREAKSAASIDHENVVRVFDAGRFDAANLCYIDTQLAGDPAPKPDDSKHVAVAKSLAALVGEGHRGKGMSAREGAALMGGVARGVAAAHARGIVHRDIKPSNIMVTPSGRPMVADFGLSALSIRTDELGANGPGGGVGGGSATTTAARTLGTGRITGTPAFMAPEQARGEAATPASDVFSLGATLRYVLTGRPPFAPSGKYSKDERWDVIEQVRRFECAPLAVERPDVPKDLAAICDHAMAPEAKDRYLTAQAMADDLAAYLEGRPVSARPPGALRATLMWAGRNRTVVGLIILMAVLGSAGLWRYIVNIGHERDRAVAAEAATAAQLSETEKARASAVAVNDFLQGVMGAADPQVLGKDAKMLDAVRLTVGSIEPRFRAHPELEANVRESIGFVFNGLGEQAAAAEQWARGYELLRRQLGEDATPTIRLRHALATLRWNMENTPETSAEVQAATDQARRVLPDDDEVRLGVEMDYSTFLGGNHRFEDAYVTVKRVVETFDRQGKGETSEAMTALRLMAGAAGYAGRTDEAVAALTKLMTIQEKSDGAAGFQRHLTMIELAGVLSFAGRAEQSAVWYRSAFEGLRPQLPPGSSVVFFTALNWAQMIASQDGRQQEAIDLLQPVLDEYAAGPQAEPDKVATGQWTLGVCYLKLKRYAEAEPLMLAGRATHVGKGGLHDDVLRRLDKRMVELYHAWGKPEEASKYLAK
jgi:serine/threonine protein kinase/tetratricopeptide (TPR) repeat protein